MSKFSVARLGSQEKRTRGREEGEEVVVWKRRTMETGFGGSVIGGVCTCWLELELVRGGRKRNHVNELGKGK
jgi:hypothetical protein